MAFGLTGTELTALVIIVILIIFIIGIFLYLARRLRARRDQLVTELKARPELVQDRAFNRLAMARREADILGRTGTDISSAQTVIAQSQAAFDLHDYPRAYELAQSAHESLVNARGKAGYASLPTAPGPTARPLRSGAGGPAAGGAGAAPAPAALPKNRAESHFLLGLLSQEVAAAPAKAGPTLEASSLRDQSQAAFDRQDYSESFRLALRGRRALGGHIESLPPTPGVGTGPSLTTGADPNGTAEAVAGSTRCPDCGHPTLSNDLFCRGCGRPLVPSTCPSCGAARAPTDVFCGKCGATFTH
ncbi:MAG TPA: zinc ribbon domain-containing protein [Thermoplasmata archaeon]|nr:zinc ribbon domain-containing protein [Thermoplasmata archaeon]